MTIVEEDRLFVNANGRFYIYNIKNNYEIKWDQSFEESELAVVVSYNTIAFGYFIMYFVEFYNEEPYNSISIHDTPFTCIVPHYNNRVISGGFDRYIAVIHLSTGEKISSLYGHTAEVRAIVSLNEDTIASCSIDGTIRVWSLSLETCTEVYDAGPKLRCMIRLSDDIIITGDDEGLINHWSLTEKKVIYSKKADENGITTIRRIDGLSYLTTSRSANVKIWMN
eukprot:CAMPEP_0170536506 /NCGR_PEP_ID=MMETSP0209-20121228/102186_1 /TAXON_ID=665100 ORGANISM="Litonotus pictus, Strain P1" /NCGR_SAMPLE_ID=MMETSP0209 /ASSEMBLY_ACC=CAM_ASM_000301 /LENGTH=223 /DNA_ID=CAMNT_0010837877 /DNA_START=2632 /DNA_END=3303 /DNA_ORIENTATION=-